MDRKPGEQGKRATGRTSTKLNISGCSAVGSALALGARCRVFESPHSDQKEKSAPGAGFLRGKRGGRAAGPVADAARRSTRRGRKNRAGEQREVFFGNRKPGEQSKRVTGRTSTKLNISGCSAVGSACTLGCEAERRRWWMQRGGARAAVEKIEQANSARFFSGTASRASKASG